VVAAPAELVERVLGALLAGLPFGLGLANSPWDVGADEVVGLADPLFLLGRILRRLRVGRRWLTGGCGREQKIKDHRTLPSNRSSDLWVEYSLSQSFVDSFRRRDGEASGPRARRRVGAEVL